MDSTELPLSTPPSDAPPPVMRLLGLGGGGSNAIARGMICQPAGSGGTGDSPVGLSGTGDSPVHPPLPTAPISSNLDGLAAAIIDTDAKALAQHPPALEKHLLAPALLRGLSTGGDPGLGRETAEAARDQLAPLVAGADIVFLALSLGGGTGAGAAPVLAELATENNALVIAFATLPFSFEGARRMRQAEESLVELRRACDAVITLPNDLLIQQADNAESAATALRLADEWMLRGVRSIHDILRRPSLINLDLASLRRAFVTRGGKTLYALASGSGENIVTETLENLRMCPLLHIAETARKVDHLIVNITAGSAVTLPRINEIMNVIGAQYGRDAHILMGASITHDRPDAIEICLLGTTDVGTRRPRKKPSVTIQKTKTPRPRMKTRANSSTTPSRSAAPLRIPTQTSSKARTSTAPPTCAKV